MLTALEQVEAVPLPARCGFWAVPGGVAVEVVARGDRARVAPTITAALAAQGVPVRALHLRSDPRQLTHPYPWRGDLRETSFSDPP